MSALLNMPWPEAKAAKYEAGMKEHRDGTPISEFVGDPAAEAHAECVDLDNYLDEMERRGVRVPATMRAAVRTIATFARSHAQSQ